jgi:hypothetical protein
MQLLAASIAVTPYNIWQPIAIDIDADFRGIQVAGFGKITANSNVPSPSRQNQKSLLR